MTTYLPVRSRFDYNTGADAATLEFTLPSRAWLHREDSVGGRRIAAGGVGASFVVRRDEIIILPLRFRETQWAAVLDLIRWGQTEENFVWYPDAQDLLESFVVYLHTPAAGTEIAPSRVPDYPRLMELTIELRRSDAPETPFPLDYYGLD